jgi:hypothetical protein
MDLMVFLVILEFMVRRLAANQRLKIIRPCRPSPGLERKAENGAYEEPSRADQAVLSLRFGVRISRRIIGSWRIGGSLALPAS